MTRLEEIRKRCDEASEGPWKAHPGGPVGGRDEWRFIGPVIGHGWIDNDSVYCEPEDAEFIAHSREDIPYLLAIVKNLRTELRLAEAEVFGLRDKLRHEKAEKRLLQSKQSL
jgi:hypothetical protein